MGKVTTQIAIYGKGGIGKSTTTSNISAALVEAGYRGVQFGCDPKGDSTNTLRGGDYMPSVLDPLRENARVDVHAAVFQGCGGTDKLEQSIRDAFARHQPRAIFIATSCATGIIGDDVGSVVAEFQARSVPVVFAETGGFRGNNSTVHELATRAIIDQDVGDDDGPREPGQVNLWSLLLYHDTFWRGDRAELGRLLAGIGLAPNILFGPDAEGVGEWTSIPRAEFNLAVSPWLGLATAGHVERKYQQRSLHIPAIPIGARETSAFLRRVGAFAGLPAARVETFIAAEETRCYRFLEIFADFHSPSWWGLPAHFAVISDSAYPLAPTRFLVDQLGLIPARAIVTDNSPDEHREAIRAEFRRIADDVAVKVDFEEDSFSLHAKLRQSDFGDKPPTLFGTTWERDLAKELKGGIIEVVRQVAAGKGLALEFIEFNDDVQPNAALGQGDLDAGSDQHRPLLEQPVKDRGYRIASIGETVTFPIGIYSKRVTSLKAVPEDDNIALPNDPTNGGRVLQLFAREGVITLRPDAGLHASLVDVVGNPKHVKLSESNAAQLPRSRDEVDVAGGMYSIGGSFCEFGETDREVPRYLPMFGDTEAHHGAFRFYADAA